MSLSGENKADSPLAHGEILNRLLRQVAKEQLPQSLVLVGPIGVEKKKLAWDLAKGFLCLQRSTSGSACGECQSCHLLQQEKHPDLLFLIPENGRIKIESIRELKRSLPISPLLSAKRVVIIEEAQQMNASAANALLKSIEEPPAGTHFFLTSSAPGLLLKTILSRCQKIWLGPVSEQDLEPRLQEFLEQSGSLAFLLNSQTPFSVVYEKVQEAVRQDSGDLLLKALLLEAHGQLCRGSLNFNQQFKLLVFCDKILEILSMLRQNLNLNIQMTNLLMALRH